MTYRAGWVPEGTTRVSDLMKICIRVSTVTEGTTQTLETGGDNTDPVSLGDMGMLWCQGQPGLPVGPSVSQTLLRRCHTEPVSPRGFPCFRYELWSVVVASLLEMETEASLVSEGRWGVGLKHVAFRVFWGVDQLSTWGLGDGVKG